MIISDSRELRSLPLGVQQLISAHQETVPVNLVGLAAALNLNVKSATLSPGISGEIRPDGLGGYIIRVNRHDSPGRQRFTVAHEIAHFLLHEEYIGAGITDDALYRSAQSDRIEAEANRLASDIVMPTSRVRDAVGERSTASGALEEELAVKFAVSPAAMKIKLGNAP